MSESNVSKDLKLWVLDRCYENKFGKVVVPHSCLRKLRSKGFGGNISNYVLRSWIIRHIYNDLHLVDTDHLTFTKIN